MKYDSKNKIVIMSLVDLEHCGFDHREYAFELECVGITAEEAQWPVALIVNFSGGHVITPETSQSTITDASQSQLHFDRIIEILQDKS